MSEQGICEQVRTTWLASSPTVYPVGQESRGRWARNKLFSVSVSYMLVRFRPRQRKDYMFEFTYDYYREISKAPFG